VSGCVFYLGTHQPHWLGRYAVPMFVSRRTLAGRKSLPQARTRWALDSGGFTELQMFGRWATSPEAYAAEVRRFRDEIGCLDWAAPQDWMCEASVIHGLVKRRNPKAKRQPAIDAVEWKRWVRGLMREGTAPRGLVATYYDALRIGDYEVVFHGTGLSVEEHQRRTVANYLRLREIAPDLPWAVALQGWTLEDYVRHVEMYRAAGVDLHAAPAILFGTMCRREATDEAARIIRHLYEVYGIRGHGLGLKRRGLEKVGHLLASADSLAWSYGARRREPLPECVAAGERHKNCANCARYAMRWRGEVLAVLEKHRRLVETEVRGWKQWDLFAGRAA
jgi:hypothetical protein